MSLNSSSSHLSPISFQIKNPRAPLSVPHHLSSLSSPHNESPKSSLRISADSSPKARFIARRRESVSVRQLRRPLNEYMSLPASQYSVLDAQRIERVDDNTFRCYVHTFKFFAIEVCPVLLVRVEEQPNGCCIKLLSCKLEGSPVVVAQNEKFDGHAGKLEFSGDVLLSFTAFPRLEAGSVPPELGNLTNLEILWMSGSALTLIWYGHAASMVNRVSCNIKESNLSVAELTSDTVIEVSIDIPFAFRPIPVQAIESTGTQILEQILRITLPRFMAQLVKDYQAWASGDTSRQPLGTGEI
ncbi:hypothetical protein RHSIM_Rhsim09G0145300 [Rhododendron simsii]|uniref:Uncharacterized protein n=1 Tax=Rhododendron simsii TaxID=118357 RepID=A0A834GGH5_RHOSS|nr:hypothetical protein RHSIM_Rhsim09G0145300 [Rhododendron simsii]